MFEYPIGLSPILQDDEESKEDRKEKYKIADCESLFERIHKVIRFENHDVTAEAYGHTYYRTNMKEILQKDGFIG